MSFTGFTRAGILIAKAAADTVKRVHQELRGKSPDILLPGADLACRVPEGAASMFNNRGQSSDAPLQRPIRRLRSRPCRWVHATVLMSFLGRPACL
jgi:aldehyde dehydrogenase (NAD+)